MSYKLPAEKPPESSNHPTFPNSIPIPASLFLRVPFVCVCPPCLLRSIFTIPKERNKTTILLAAELGSTAAASLKFYISIKVRCLKCFARRAGKLPIVVAPRAERGSKLGKQTPGASGQFRLVFPEFGHRRRRPKLLGSSVIRAIITTHKLGNYAAKSVTETAAHVSRVFRDIRFSKQPIFQAPAELENLLRSQRK